MTRPRRLAAVCALALVLLPGRAAAEEVSAAEFRRLAEVAAEDPSALAELRNVTAVDGRPVDVDRALQGATGDRLQARLRTLAADAPAGAVDAAEARQAAADILSDRRYRRGDPSLASRITEWVVRALEWLTRPLRRLFRSATDALPGGQLTFWVILALLVLAVAVLVTTRLGRRRIREVEAAAEARERAGSAERPERLEEAARRAEARGAYAAAVRLRFRAGLLRLDRAGAVDLQPSLTTGAVAEQLASESFQRVAARFEEVAYGERAASEADAAGAAAGWRRILEEVSRR